MSDAEHYFGKPLGRENQISILSAPRDDDDDEDSDDSTVFADDGADSGTSRNKSDANITDQNKMLANATKRRTLILTAVVAFLGAASAGMFIAFGMTAAGNEEQQRFHHLAEELALQVEAAWGDYETASRWLHQACAFQNITRQEFRDLYQYMTVSLDVQVGDDMMWRTKIRSRMFAQ